MSATPQDSLRVVALIDSSNKYHSQFKLIEANNFIRKAKALAQEKNTKSLFAYALYLQGIISDYSGDFNYSIQLYKQSLDYYLQKKNVLKIADIYGAIGTSYSKKGNYPEALEYYLKALKLYETNKNKEFLASTLANISIVYWGQEQFDTALEYLNKSTQIRKKLNNKSGLAYNYGNEALYYTSKNEVEKAIATYKKTILLCTDLNDINCLANAYNNLGLLMKDKGNFKVALDYQKKALNFRGEMEDNNGLASSYTNIGEIYFAQNKIDSALTNALEGIYYAEETESWEDIKDGAKLVSDVYEIKKNYAKALRYFKTYSDAKDTLFNAVNTEKFTRTQMNYEFEKKQQKQFLQEQITNNELSKNKAERNLVFILLISAILFILLIYREYLNKNKTNKILLDKNVLLVELNREKDALTKIVAHDLKTPIGQVKGLAQLMEMVGTLNSDQKEVLEKMNKSVNYGNKLIENLLNINKLEDPEIKVEMALCNIQKLILKAIENNAANASLKNITVSQNISYLNDVNTNAEFLLEIIENLISNAIKFTKGGRKVFVNCFEKEQNIIVQIKDEGQGFSINDKERLFGKYQKLSARPTGGERSTGLGLYIVKLLADKIKVQVNLESTQSVGSIFTISIKK